MRSINSTPELGKVFITTLGFIFLITATAWGASAVAISKNNLKFGLCFEKNSNKEAEECAISKCGANCKVVKSCKEIGYGAIYQNYLSKLN